MDLRKLARHEFYAELAKTVDEKIDQRIERREENKEAKVEKVLARKARANRRAWDIDTLYGRSSSEPIIVLGRLSPSTYIAATLAHTFSPESNHGGGKKNFPLASFYKVNESEIRPLQADPFTRENLERCEFMEHEIALSAKSEGYLRESLKVTTPKIPEEVFNPLGAIRVAGEVVIAQRDLRNFERTLDVVDSAIRDTSLNPRLAEILQQPVPRQSHWAMASLAESVPLHS